MRNEDREKKREKRRERERETIAVASNETNKKSCHEKRERDNSPLLLSHTTPPSHFLASNNKIKN